MAKKSSSSSFSLFGLFKSKNSSSSSRSSKRGGGDDYYSSKSSRADDYVKAYKVYPSDEDRGRWVAEPGIDKKASAYITLTTNKWENLDLAN